MNWCSRSLSESSNSSTQSELSLSAAMLEESTIRIAIWTFLVIMRTDKPFAERTIEVDSIFGLRDWAMDIVVYTPQEFAHQQKVWGTLAATVNAEGKVLYERPR